jgi:hypothetical protein
VLREASPDMRRFLVGTSLLERIVPPHAFALFAADEPPPRRRRCAGGSRRHTTSACLAGAASQAAVFATTLLREFLLASDARRPRPESRDAPAGRRRRRSATPAHLLPSLPRRRCARRRRSRPRALRARRPRHGSWGAAAGIVAQLEGHTTGPDIEVILALQEIEEGRLPKPSTASKPSTFDTVGPTTPRPRPPWAPSATLVEWGLGCVYLNGAGHQAIQKHPSSSEPSWKAIA